MATSLAPDIDWEETRQTLFTNWMANTRLRNTWKIKFSEFSERSDPKAHISAFRLAVARFHLNNEEKDICYNMLFIENITGLMLKWFARLYGNFGGKFTQLATAFLNHYSVFIKEMVSEGAIFQ